MFNQLSKYFHSTIATNHCGFRFHFTVLSISDAGKVQGSNRKRKSI